MILLPDGAITYAYELVADVFASRTDSYCTPAMRYGITHESEALGASGLDATQTGKHQGLFYNPEKTLSCHPDGVIRDPNIMEIDEEIIYGGRIVAPVEVKCQEAHNHLRCVCEVRDATTLRGFNEKFYWQVQAQCACLGTSCGYLVAYNETFSDKKLHLRVTKIEANDFHQQMIAHRTRLVSEKIAEILATIRAV